VSLTLTSSCPSLRKFFKFESVSNTYSVPYVPYFKLSKLVYSLDLFKFERVSHTSSSSSSFF
jgi:hypothetical protein